MIPSLNTTCWLPLDLANHYKKQDAGLRWNFVLFWQGFKHVYSFLQGFFQVWLLFCVIQRPGDGEAEKQVWQYQFVFFLYSSIFLFYWNTWKFSTWKHPIWCTQKGSGLINNPVWCSASLEIRRLWILGHSWRWTPAEWLWPGHSQPNPFHTGWLLSRK